MRKLLRKHGRAPRVLITDKLKSYAAANRDLAINVEHRQHKGAEQPGGKLAPANADAREGDAPLQFSASPARLRFGPHRQISRLRTLGLIKKVSHTYRYYLTRLVVPPLLLLVLSLVSTSFPPWPLHTEFFSQIAKTQVLRDFRRRTKN
jgi:hypothetical protein